MSNRPTEGEIPKDPLLNLGREVKSRRESKGISQEALAHCAMIDTTYLSKIERGIANPSYLVMLSVAAALNVTIKDLLA